jgi:GTP-binding protein
MKQTASQIRNIAIIAHVDHGKTTLVDQLFRQSGTFRENENVVERAMDSMDQEQERGITITAKNTSISYEDKTINIIDTPGHADFGGEVERVLNMADGVLLLVDSVEGTMPQTRYVLSKALSHGFHPIVVINKVDRPHARVDDVINMTFDLFVELGANDEQCDFPVVYASALEGRASTTDTQGGTDLKPLFDKIVEHVPSPKILEGEEIRMVVTNLGYDDFLGKLVIGRLLSGTVKVGSEVKVFSSEGENKGFRVTKILKRAGLKDEEMETLIAGDIATLSGIQATIGDTIASPSVSEALERIEIDPPTLSMTFSVNDSPFAGKEGKYVTSRNIRDRLYKEIEHNVSLKVEDTESAESFKVSGRGELHLSVLIETMRREGYELQVSQPEVIIRTGDDGKVEEPFEQVFIEVPSDCSGTVIESLNRRKGEMQNMNPIGERVEIEFIIPSRGLLGYRGQFLTETRGEGIMNSLFHDYGPHKGDIQRRLKGSIISTVTGEAVAFSIGNLQARGVFFVGPGTSVYEGMVVGEHAKDNDLEVNITKGKKLTNMRASGNDEAIKLIPPRKLTIESILEFVTSEELMEVTPKSLRVRKRFLTESERRAANRKRG